MVPAAHVVEPGRRYDGDSNNHGCGVSTTLSLFPGSSTTLSVDIDQYLLNGSFLDVLAELENPTTNWSVLYNTSGGAYTSAPTTYTYVRIRHDLPTDRLVTEYSNDRWHRSLPTARLDVPTGPVFRFRQRQREWQ